ncbi:MAG TPA: histidine phosphatase family protein, partial [Candidatus Tyrphobacter sp.]|nr:histidine phosphatase family protein [Candidatus Tyrphobacter sp.]
MKKVYFIRHGESEGNAANIRQDATPRLTEKGIRQAEFVAKRCLSLPIELIVSSTMKRAQETAGIISQRINRPIETSNLFIERRVPSEQVGLRRDNPSSLEIDKIIEKKFTSPGFRYSDEEGFDDLNARSQKALSFLGGLPQENILVVTHGFFMNII